MATTMRAGDVTLHDLSARFGLQLTKDATFFLEWHAELPAISECVFHAKAATDSR